MPLPLTRLRAEWRAGTLSHKGRGEGNKKRVAHGRRQFLRRGTRYYVGGFYLDTPTSPSRTRLTVFNLFLFISGGHCVNFETNTHSPVDDQASTPRNPNLDQALFLFAREYCLRAPESQQKNRQEKQCRPLLLRGQRKSTQPAPLQRLCKVTRTNTS